MKKTFSRIGIAYAAMLLTSQGIGFIIDLVCKRLGVNIDNYIYKLILTVICNYLIGGFTLFVHLRKLDTENKEKNSMSLKNFLCLFVVAESLGILANLFGSSLAYALSGGTASNPLNEIAELSAFTVIVTVIVAPICEELLCRKLLIDRIVKYGEKTAVIMSGLIFGLFHTNIYQFFYAFIIGMILAYIYIRTKDIRYPIAFHALFNFLGGVVPLLVLENTDILMNPAVFTSDEEITTYLMALLPMMAYLFVELLMVVFGLILIGRNYKKITFNESEYEIEKDQALKNACMNTGMIVYTVVCVAFTVYVLLKY